MSAKYVFLLALSFFIHTALTAQVSLSGKVLTEEGNALGDASISLLSIPDSLVYAQQKTDQRGNFSFRVDRPGTYKLHYKILGFEPHLSADLDLKAGEGLHTAVPVILRAAGQEIEAVSVVGKQPGIRQYVDKMVVDVEGTVLSEGNNLLELLEKTPGVLADGKGNFSIQGRAGARVIIDGRDTYLSGEQLASMLRGMQASDVAKLELMSNPSTREDAAGTAGIINIVTKRNKKLGFGGDVFVRGSRSRGSQGVAGGGIHYRVNSLDMYINGSLGYEQSKDSSAIEREFYTDGSVTMVQRQKEQKRLDPGRYHSLRTGASYTFDDGGVLDASFHWMRGRFISAADINMWIDDRTHVDMERATTNNRFDEMYNNLTFNINYVNKYEGEDHFLKINLDYAPHTNEYDNIFQTNFFEREGTDRGNTARTNKQALSNTTYAGRLDYSAPLGDAGKLELGWKATYFFINNDVANDTLQDNSWVRDYTTSNRFQYTQHIEALYFIFSGKLQKLEYQVGLRGEYTFIKAEQMTLQETNRQRYMHIFPNASATYHLNEQHLFRASVSSRIERPGDHDINAFRIYEDAYSYIEGNPNLQPERSYIAELGHGFRNKLFTTVSMSYGLNVINWVSRVGSLPAENLTRPENIGRYRNYSASMMYNNSFSSWWTASHYLNGFYNSYSGAINDITLDNSGSSWSANSKHTLHFARGLRGEASAYYNSGVTTGARRSDRRYGLDLAAEKKMWKDRAMVKIAATGLIRNANPRYTSQYGDLIVYHSDFPDNRKIIVSVSYRFGE
ncbi:TonB-dependent receptor domain-containing protein [Sphingobacterium pedocola]|uniref:Outer membrane protein beta-barrel domain-containing protein n=1 Tax=Sphingobacterium pedocola TaxID=2082722 RepID=A0ABR9T752_9SPHI|nr:TonB-dependent receptor [Sphingobacterium pedocola]MBE8721151.1 hypothetical protein [Sphingobacterium pedocola]